MRNLIVTLPLVASLLLTLTACEGYRSINSTATLAEGEGVDVGNIYVQSVKNTHPEQKSGERRIAQKMAQELRRRFVGGESAPFRVRVTLSDEQRSLSSRRDATVSRWMYFLEGRAIVNHKGEKVADITSRSDAPYFVERSPVATQANLKQAEEAAARVLTRDMHRQLNILLHEYAQKEAQNKTQTSP
mgnify:CR=1 FL=1